MKVHRKALCILFLLLLLVNNTSALAAIKEHERAPKEAPPSTPFRKNLVEDHKTISKLFDSIAEGLDSFLVSQQQHKEDNKTRVILINTHVLTEGQGYQNVNNLAIHLHLPNFEKYWQLKFTNYDEQTTERGVRGSYLRQNQGPRNYGATVGFLRRFKSVEFSFTPRILLEDPLNISHSMNFETKLETKLLHFSPKIEFFATPEKGTGIFFGLNSGFYFSDVYSLFFINEGEYQEKAHLFTATQGVSLGQRLNDISSMSYNLFFISNNRPNYHLNNYSISVAYNTILYKDIIDTQLIPALSFSEERNFLGVSSFTVNFNIYF